MTDVVTLRGSGRVELPVSVARMLSFKVRSAGCQIFVGDSLETAELVYAGSGDASVKAAVSGGAMLIVASEKNAAVRLEIPELRASVVGWTDEPSLTDLSPRPFGAVSPEIRAVMDAMNRNAIIREQAMLRALGQR